MVTFDGTDDYFDLPDATIPTGDNDYTMYVLDIPNNISSENILINAGNVSLDDSLGISTNNAGNGTVTDYWLSNNLNTTATPLVVGEPTLIATTYSNALTGTNRFIYIDGALSASETEASTRTTTSTTNRIGSRTDGSFDLDGAIPEIVVYQRYLTANERQRIDTYFAIKYGLTVGTGTTDYLSSSGVVIWDAAANGMYNQDVAGIGKELAQALDQQKSRSSNSDSVLTIDASSSTGFDDQEFMVWGNNGLSATGWTTSEVASGYVRLPREWTISEVGEVGTTRVILDFSGLNYQSGVYLLVDSVDTDLTDSTPLTMTLS